MQGEVSILAHSLGSVLSYDILCNQPHLFSRMQHATPGATLPDQLHPLGSKDLDPAALRQVRQSTALSCGMALGTVYHPTYWMQGDGTQPADGAPAVQPVSLGTEVSCLTSQRFAPGLTGASSEAAILCAAGSAAPGERTAAARVGCGKAGWPDHHLQGRSARQPCLH